MAGIKKTIAKALQSDLVGGCIRAFSGSQISYHGGVKVPVSHAGISNRIVSSVYFGIYEKSEAILIQKHLHPDLPTIEMGASLGMISTLIGKNTSGAIVGLEPNASLADYHQGILQANGVETYELICGAYSASNSELQFLRGTTNLHGQVVESGGDISGDTVPGLSILKIREKMGQEGPFQLVCDIEGGEVELILKESGALTSCALIIAELHNTNYEGQAYGIEDIASLFESNGFERLDQRGHVMVFRNKAITL